MCCICHLTRTGSSVRNILWLNGLCLLCFQFRARVCQHLLYHVSWPWWWLPLTFARLSGSLWVWLFVCSTVCLLAKICYRALGSYTLRRSQTAQQFIKVSCCSNSSWSCPRQPSECVLVVVLCSVLFASVSLTLSFIICSANSWVCEGIA